ncbi:hypothetical protein TRFO_16179 [Tritrichomonas foetus]|uniref:Uncharacterized protein n=1 Tax=Tritrichomonas foetus TaxID=1144522 RepID=A0A1J4KV56_9EUKA|nr:hypothetical protein TRFO_16179 [Tritrichomonas foetus]|eukprot:OHT13628.1 hypothetical protein TRFO_16179 [Tritrichomonas foetus]
MSSISNSSLFADALNMPGLELLEINEQLRIFLSSENPHKIYELGKKIFLLEDKTEKDSEICFELMLEASKNKIMESYYFLGKYYFEGILPISRDLDKAYYYFNLITKNLYFNSNISSETQLQSRIERKLKKFHVKTISDKMDILEQEIENGFYQPVKSNHNHYNNGQNEKNYHRKKRTEFEKIVSYSFLYLGFICENFQDFGNAYQMFIRSANIHNYDALAAISIYRICGKGGAYHNRFQAVKLLKLCFEKCSVYACYEIAGAHLKGNCFLINECKAFNYFCKASLSKNLLSASMLGICLFVGKGIEPNEELGKDIYYLSYHLSKSYIFKSSQLYQKLFGLLRPYIKKYQKSSKYSYLTDHVHNTLFNSFCCQKFEQTNIFNKIGILFHDYTLHMGNDRGFNINVKGFLQKGPDSTRNLGFYYINHQWGYSDDEDQFFYLIKLSQKYHISGNQAFIDHILGLNFFNKKFRRYKPLKGLKYLLRSIDAGNHDSYSVLYEHINESEIALSSKEMKDKSYVFSVLKDVELYLNMSCRKNVPQEKYEALYNYLQYYYEQGFSESMYPYGRELLFSDDKTTVNKGRKIIEKAFQYGAYIPDVNDIRMDCAQIVDQYNPDRKNRTILLFLLHVGCLNGFSSCYTIFGYILHEFKYPEELIYKAFRKGGLLQDGFSRTDYAKYILSNRPHEIDKLEIAANMYLLNDEHNEHKAVVSLLKNMIN